MLSTGDALTTVDTAVLAATCHRLPPEHLHARDAFVCLIKQRFGNVKYVMCCLIVYCLCLAALQTRGAADPEAGGAAILQAWD
jgi:hypothetical protein